MLKRLFLRCYAAMYDLLNEPTERAGLRQQRHDLLAQAAGATIEIGAGTGLNLPHYPSAVTRLALIEPDPHMARPAAPTRRPARPRRADHRRHLRPVALPGRLIRHRGDHVRAVQPGRAGGAERDHAGAGPGRATAVPRARPLRRSADRRQARQEAVPLPADRLSPQPGHAAGDQGVAADPGIGPEQRSGQGPQDRAAHDRGRRPPTRPSLTSTAQGLAEDRAGWRRQGQWTVTGVQWRPRSRVSHIWSW